MFGSQKFSLMILGLMTIGNNLIILWINGNNLLSQFQ